MSRKSKGKTIILMLDLEEEVDFHAVSQQNPDCKIDPEFSLLILHTGSPIVRGILFKSGRIYLRGIFNGGEEGVIKHVVRYLHNVGIRFSKYNFKIIPAPPTFFSKKIKIQWDKKKKPNIPVKYMCPECNVTLRFTNYEYVCPQCGWVVQRCNIEEICRTRDKKEPETWIEESEMEAAFPAEDSEC